MANIEKVSDSQKFKDNPFVADEYLKIDRGKRTIIAGNTNKLLMDKETGEIEGITLMHRYKEVDKTTFVKLYTTEISSLFELSKTGLKTFGYVLNNSEINKDTIYIFLPDLIAYAGWTSLKQAYRGLGELIANKIIAMSNRPNIWFINPNIFFNGDRIAFIKEYRLKETKESPKQIQAEFPSETS